MTLSLTLDVAISLIFVWLLSSVLAGAVNEAIAGWFNLRGAYLSKAIETLTSLGEKNAFGWGGLGQWVQAIWRSQPQVSNEVDKAAIEARKRANDAAKLVGADPQKVADAIKATPNFDKLNLNKRLEDAVAKQGATADDVAAVMRRIGGIADLQNHPLIVDTPRSLPSYVPARDFAAALLGVMTEAKASNQAQSFKPEEAFEQAKSAINDLPNGDLKTILLSFINTGVDDFDKLRDRVEKWFDDSMERLGGIYKRLTQFVMLALGLIIALAFNVDSVHLAQTLWEQPTLSKAIADQAANYVKDCEVAAAKAASSDVNTGTAIVRTPPGDTKNAPAGAASPPGDAKNAPTGAATPPTDSTTIAKKCLDVDTTRGLIDKTLPIGSQSTDNFFKLQSWLGWLITALAVSLGAQFWFDLLIRFVNLRAAGPKPERADAPKSKSKPAGATTP